MKDYNKIISDLRIVARDELRLKATNRYRDELLAENVNLKNFEDSIKEYKKTIAIAEFDIRKLDPEDPRIEDVTKNCNESIKFSNRHIADYTRTIESIKERIEEINEKIANVETGETKIMADKLSTVTSQLIEKLVNEQAKSLAPEFTPSVDGE